MASGWRRPSILTPSAASGASAPSGGVTSRRDTVEIALPPVVVAAPDDEWAGYAEAERERHRLHASHTVGGRRRKRKRPKGLRAAVTTFANHLAPPPHADARALGHLRDACPTCAASVARSTAESSGRSSGGSGASLGVVAGGAGGVAGAAPIAATSAAAAASAAAAGVGLGGLGLRARRAQSHGGGTYHHSSCAQRRAANPHVPGGWMLADDEQYRAFPRRGTGTWSIDDESDGGGGAGGGRGGVPPTPVHAVVVDSDFAPCIPPSSSESDDTASTRSKTSLGAKSNAPTHTSRIWYYLREGIIIPLWHFADSSFSDPAMERHFLRERWIAEKAGAMMGALYLMLQWILLVALQFQYNTFYYYAYLGIVGFFTVPLPFMVGFNGPRRFQWLYQPFVFGATWSMGYLLVIEMNECGYQWGDDPRNQCGERTFLHMLGLVYGLPTVASLGLWGHRVVTVTGACIFAALSVALFVPHWSRDRPWISQPICLVVYHIYISLWCYWRERADRQIFLLRQQLNLQYTELETAQIMEHRAQHSKKQFVSYIFHEVRVPLNTALLAVQNLDAEGVFGDLDEDRGMMVHGLSSSLSMMEKVLNDVLSFDRMESGQLVQARKPFDFNKSMRVVALAHRAQADHSGVDFHVQLDPRVDDLGLLVGDEMRLRQITSNLASNALKFTHNGSVSIVTKLLSPSEDTGVSPGVSRRTSVATGRMRTPPPPPTPPTTTPFSTGSTKVATSSSTVPSDGSAADWDTVERSLKTLDEKRSVGEVLDEKALGDDKVEKDVELGDVQVEMERARAGTATPRASGTRSRRRYAIVRVEVHDTGPGLRPSDLAENRLFHPYVQTEIGRRQGGKGSGLGLALVMQLVKISHGRLGVDSVLGQGSVFWFELQYPLYDPRPGSAAGTGTVPGTAGGSVSGVPRSPGSPSSGRFINLPVLRNLSIPSGKFPARFDGRRQSAPSPTPSTTTQAATRRGSDAPSRIHLRLGSVTEVSKTTTPTDSVGDASRAVSPGGGNAAADTHRASRNSSQSEPLRELGFRADIPSRAASQGTASDVGGVRRASDLSAPTPAPFEYSRAWTLDASCAAVGTTATGTARGAPGCPLSPGSGTPVPPSDADATAAKPTPPRTPPPALTPSPRPLAALVVDDDTLTRRLMSRMITRLGAKVTTAENGRAALDTIAQNDFDVVFLDNQMPLMSGVEVVRALRAQGSRLFVVGCTGNALEEDQNEYLSAGADSILPKPIYQRDVERKLVEAHERLASRLGGAGGVAAANAAARAQAGEAEG